MLDQVYGWLYPADEGRPEYDTLASSLSSGATSLTASGLVTYVPKTIIEIGYEAILTKEVESSTTWDLNERGWRDTVAAAHSSGDKIWIDPDYYRLDLYNALNSLIQDLYSMGLYQRTLDATYTWTTSPTDLPASCLRVIAIRAKNGTVYSKPLRKGWDWEEMTEFSPHKLQLLTGGTNAGELRMVYAKDFTALNADPTHATAGEAADLTSYCGIPASLVTHLPMAVAAYAMRGRENVRLSDEIRSKLAAEGIPVGAHLSLSEQLLNIFERKYASAEVEKLRMLDGVRTVFRR